MMGCAQDLDLWLAGRLFDLDSRFQITRRFLMRRFSGIRMKMKRHVRDGLDLIFYAFICAILSAISWVGVSSVDGGWGWLKFQIPSMTFGAGAIAFVWIGLRRIFSADLGE